ncbi:MAG TPA: 3-ketoacyl-ACP reductase [Candidatus Lokiarchaeia archaeon]|nr:3-ketoacyl-ACP reductase [Candidatus Lokiarchaeia archaeon]
MENKVALVTGSTRGIGFAIALRLIVEGFFVIFNGVSSSEIEEEKLAIIDGAAGDAGHGSYKYIQASIGTTEGRETLLDFVKNEAKRIDVLVNNAGIAPRERKDILDLSVDEYQENLSVNLEGPFFLSQAIARLMLGYKDSGAIPSYLPCIVNISSMSAYTSSPNRAAYCIAKAGVSMMTSLFAVRLADVIPVHEIRPGIIDTDMTAPVIQRYQEMIDDGLLPIARVGKPEDVAEAVIAILHGHFPYSTGNVIDVDGGFHLRKL